MRHRSTHNIKTSPAVLQPTRLPKQSKGRKQESDDSQSGFTLIELSIVLVIVGLLVGGVLVGNDLVKAAELRSLHGNISEISSAYNTYRLKYNCLPGDCRNATTFFGKNTSLCNSDSGSAGTPGTCNGNGNWRIQSENIATRREGAEAIKQLMLAEFIVGTPTASATPPAIYKWFDDSGVNALFHQQGDMHNNGVIFPFGLYFYGGVGRKNNAFQCEDILSFDLKYDDGKPDSGKLIIVPEDPSDGNIYCVNLANTEYAPDNAVPFGGSHFFHYRLD